MNWNELFLLNKQVSPEEIVALLTALTEEEPSAMEKYMLNYNAMDSQRRAVLGYCAAFIQTDINGFKDPYAELALEWYESRQHPVPKFEKPVQFYGWAGEYSDTGPAMSIRKEAFPQGNEVIFYTDTEIAENEESALELAAGIAAESSGICDVRVEKLTEFAASEGPEPGDHVGIVFSLSEDAVKDALVIGGKRVPAQESGGYVFVLPKAGEFDSIIGELAGGTCFALSKDIWCMK